MKHHAIIIILLALASSATDAFAAGMRRLKYPASASVARKAELPPGVRSELDTRLGGVAELGSDYRADDNPSSPDLPRFRFHSALLIRGEWFGSLEMGSATRLQTIGLRRLTDAVTGSTSHGIWSAHNLIGARCIAIEAMLEGVERP